MQVIQHWKTKILFSNSYDHKYKPVIRTSIKFDFWPDYVIQVKWW